MRINSIEEETREVPRRRVRGTHNLVFVVAIILFLGSWFFGERIHIFFAARGYQSVFMSNGQVYFGKLSVSGRYMKLTDIYYLQAAEPLQSGATPALSASQAQIQLIKLGSELHGPDDAMYIERDQVLFWENLKDDSKVVAAINQNR